MPTVPFLQRFNILLSGGREKDQACLLENVNIGNNSSRNLPVSCVSFNAVAELRHFHVQDNLYGVCPRWQQERDLIVLHLYFYLFFKKVNNKERGKARGKKD